MARSNNADPLDRFRWKVYIVAPAGTQFSRAGFTTCSSPGITIDYNAYPEGGSHMVPRLIHNGATFKPITLTRGVISQKGVDDFSKWMEDVFKALNPEPGSAPVKNYRRDIVIEHLDRDGDVVKRYTMRNCVPTAYEPASDFSSMDETALSIETLSFSYEGFEEHTEGDLTSVLDNLRGLF